jgi:hypothetical protein
MYPANIGVCSSGKHYRWDAGPFPWKNHRICRLCPELVGKVCMSQSGTKEVAVVAEMRSARNVATCEPYWIAL